MNDISRMHGAAYTQIFTVVLVIKDISVHELFNE